ncbi:Threonine/homoserine/homoserine lactone efflux protein [Arboricoccus pini]|uniref:Threonine/homoserine/homoserine lactone efflux protein n=1 Tax=Arboricoccus pini TaxID=1963835 RepID=A0A212Q323_9PROT|nr:LysE family transporter [Arboricoccus pini]SNB53654.1 Threonine/homoserine/homoserine lactone efflux protein [Arboricoccus pini]
MIPTTILASLAMPYALVLITPGPNLMVVLRIAMRPSWHRSASIASGVATGAALVNLFAAMSATVLHSMQQLQLWGSTILALVLLRSAIQLVRSARRQRADIPAEPSQHHVQVFALGLATALANPFSFTFFVSTYVATPGLTTVQSVLLASSLIFLMALCWFFAVSRLFSVSVARCTTWLWRAGLCYALAALMAAYALWLVLAHTT